MIRFKCPTCQVEYEEADNRLGMKVSCAKCGTKFYVPEEGHEAKLVPPKNMKAKVSLELENRSDRRKTMICPDCQTNVQSDMKYCPGCGSVLDHCALANSEIPPGTCLKWFSKILNYAWEEKKPCMLFIPVFTWLFIMVTSGVIFFALRESCLLFPKFLFLLLFNLNLIPVLLVSYAICYGVKKYHENNEEGFRIAIFFLILSILALILPSLLFSIII